MADQEQARKGSTTRTAEGPPTDHQTAQAGKASLGHARETAAAAGAELDEIDEVLADGDAQRAAVEDLLDDVEEVLEANAEDFVRSYVQKGGE